MKNELEKKATLLEQKELLKKEKYINKKSRGFCMYDWMIDNILNNGKI